MIGQILSSMTALATPWLDSKQLTDQLLRWQQFAMPAAALQRDVVIDYGLQLGHAWYKIVKDAMW
jgi:hypothetical protein